MRHFYWNEETVEYFAELSQIHNHNKMNFKIYKFVDTQCSFEYGETSKDLVDSLHKQVMYAKIKEEIKRLKDDDYWGSAENIENENDIFDYFLSNDYTDQEWFDKRLRYTNIERLRQALEL